MAKLLNLGTAAAVAASLAIPGIALAQNNGGPETNNLPSQRLAVTNSAGQGAILTISSSGVREVQQALNRLGYSAGPITGSWNRRTQQSMKEFQAAHGLEPTGNLDISSIDALGLWSRVIGNPIGNGRMMSENSGAPVPRGNEGYNNGGGNGEYNNGGGNLSRAGYNNGGGNGGGYNNGGYNNGSGSDNVSGGSTVYGNGNNGGGNASYTGGVNNAGVNSAVNGGGNSSGNSGGNASDNGGGNATDNGNSQ